MRPSAVTVVSSEGTAGGPTLEVARNKDTDRIHCFFAHIHRDGHEHAIRTSCTRRAGRISVCNVAVCHKPLTVRIVRVIGHGSTIPSINHLLNQVLLDSVYNPQVLHGRSRCRIKGDRPQAGSNVQFGDWATGGVPSPEGASQANLGHISNTTAAHVQGGHKRSHRRSRAGSVRAAFPEAGGEGRIRTDVNQLPIVVIGRVSARQTGKVLLAGIISARTVGERVVSRVA